MGVKENHNLHLNYKSGIHKWLPNHGAKSHHVSEFYKGGGGSEGEREPKEVEGRQACLASNQGFQDTGKLMQEIKLSHNGHVDCPCQGPAHWKSELVEYVIRVVFHATPFSGGHLSSH